MSERLVLLIAPAEGVRHVDGDLAFEPAHLGERLGDRTRRNGDEDDVGVGRVTAVAPERRDSVARLLPEPSESTSDVSPADGW
jgi:hypothetical protein